MGDAGEPLSKTTNHGPGVAMMRGLSRMPGEMQGASVGSWKYKIIRFPGVKGNVLGRQIAAEAMGENLEEMERSLDRLLNSSSERRQ
jgi:hypothetical protein